MSLRRIDLTEPSEDEKKIIRLDPISVFLLLLATSVFIGILIQSGNQYTDLVSYTQKYFLIFGLGAIFALVGIGKHFYNFGELAPITRPVFDKKGRKKLVPDVALISIFLGFIAIGVTDYLITRFGFFPTLSFWTNITQPAFYAAGGIYEEFVFRVVVYGTVNRFFPYGLKNPLISVLFIGPVDSGIFALYHTWAYANSRIALDMVWMNSYVLTVQFRGTRYCLWVCMVLHAVNNILAPP